MKNMIFQYNNKTNQEPIYIKVISEPMYTNLGAIVVGFPLPPNGKVVIGTALQIYSVENMMVYDLNENEPHKGHFVAY